MKEAIIKLAMLALIALFGLTRWIWLVEVETKELKDRVHRLESRIERAENH